MAYTNSSCWFSLILGNRQVSDDGIVLERPNIIRSMHLQSSKPIKYITIEMRTELLILMNKAIDQINVYLTHEKEE